MNSNLQEQALAISSNTLFFKLFAISRINKFICQWYGMVWFGFISSLLTQHFI